LRDSRVKVFEVDGWEDAIGLVLDVDGWDDVVLLVVGHQF